MDTPFFLTSAVLALVALSYVWFILFAELRRDNFRADIRRLRDELFDHMWKHELSFDSEAYVETRQILNGFLRMSNRITVLSFLIRAYFSSRSERANDFLESIGNTGDETLKAKVRDILSSAVIRLLKFVFLEGTTGLCVSTGLKIVGFLNKLATLQRWAKGEARRMLFDAYMVGATH